MNILDVCVVVSPKDNYALAIEQINLMLQTVPNTVIIHYLIGRPIPDSVYEYLVEMTRKHLNLILHDYGNDSWLPNPMELRHYIVPYVHQKYIFYIYNDMIPVNDDWLTVMYKTAEDHQEHDVFQAMLWEDMDHYHADYTALNLIKCNGIRYIEHKFRDEVWDIKPNWIEDRLKIEPKWKDDVKEGPQHYHLEDHGVLYKTQFLKDQKVSLAYTGHAKEFLNLILYLRMQKSLPYLVRDCGLVYAKVFDMSPEQILLKTYRRSDAVSFNSTKNMEKVWGFKYPYDGFSNTFIDIAFTNKVWEDIPKDVRLQTDMFLGMFVGIGFNRFRKSRDTNFKQTNFKQTNFKQTHNKNNKTFFSFRDFYIDNLKEWLRYNKENPIFPLSEFKMDMKIDTLQRSETSPNLPDFKEYLEEACEKVIECEKGEECPGHAGLKYDYTVKKLTLLLFSYDSPNPELNSCSSLTYFNGGQYHYLMHLPDYQEEMHISKAKKYTIDDTFSIKFEKDWRLLRWAWLPSK